jgi:hypothetical protein
LPILAAQIVLLGLLAWISAVGLASVWIGRRLVRNKPIGTLFQG